MPRWFGEKILIAYWEENSHKYKLPNGIKVLKAERNPNFDAYPDIIRNELENGEIVPCEIEWATTKFKEHKHDINLLIESNGFLVTFIENSAFDVPQVIIDNGDLLKWFKKKSGRLLEETLDIIRANVKERTDSFIWIIYIANRGKKDAQIAFNNGIWGFPEDKKRKRRGLDEIKQIKTDDIVIFIKEFTSDDNNKIKTPRIKDLSKLRGKIKEIIAVRVTKGYYFDEANTIWENKIYPHRFDFDKDTIFKGENINFNPEIFGIKLHEQVAARINASTIEHIDATQFVKIMNICANN